MWYKALKAFCPPKIATIGYPLEFNKNITTMA
jgi:hypothetical protein